MTLMDDHALKYRIKGMRTLSALLDKCDAAFLRRTALDQLVQEVRVAVQLCMQLTRGDSP
jgi:hypothetical protein